MYATTMKVENVKSLNIFILGLVFMFIFTGFNTMTGIQVRQVSGSSMFNMFSADNHIQVCNNRE